MAESKSEIVLKANTHTQTKREKLGSSGWGVWGQKEREGERLGEERNCVYDRKK